MVRKLAPRVEPVAIASTAAAADLTEDEVRVALLTYVKRLQHEGEALVSEEVANNLANYVQLLVNDKGR